MKSAIDIMHRRSEDLVRELVARAPAGSVRAVFAGGSVGRGEVWWGREGEGFAVYSDIDVYVVLSPDADEAAVRSAGARAAAGLPSAQDGVVFHRGADIGVYRIDDLLAQPVRPGTVDLREHHLWLYGDRSVLDGLGAGTRRVPRSEALYLLENRAWDALDAASTLADDGAHARVHARMQAAKVVMDVGAAHLIADGRFVPTYAGRMDAIRQQSPALLAPRVLSCIEAADALRNGSLASSVAVDTLDALALVCEAWVALAPSILSGAKDAGSQEWSREGGDAAALLGARCARNAYVDNYREFVRLRGPMGRSRAGTVVAAWRFANLSPRSTLRTVALAHGLVGSGLATAESLRFHTRYADALAARLGCHQDTFDQRARAALRAVS